MNSRPQFTDLTYMGATGSCPPVTLIFGTLTQSQQTSLNIKFGVNRQFHVVKTTVYRFDLYGMTILFCGIIQSQYRSLNIKFGVTRPFHVLKTLVQRFVLYERYQVLCTDDDNFFSVIQSQHRNLNIKFGVNRTFYELKTPVYRFDLYGRYRILWTDDDSFWWCYLELAYKPKHQIWCESTVPCGQDPSLPI